MRGLYYCRTKNVSSIIIWFSPFGLTTLIAEEYYLGSTNPRCWGRLYHTWGEIDIIVLTFIDNFFTLITAQIHTINYANLDNFFLLLTFVFD